MQLKGEILNLLRKGKNLLAFSYGSDSSALFYFLLQEQIDFDLAMINYKMRKNSDLEELEAKKLALKFHKKIFIKSAPVFKNNFEKNARDFRYDFFDQICFEQGYEHLILAHHLNDQFEWFLMQISRGAGLLEILGMQEREKRKNYTIVRPLLFIDKNEILSYLKQENIFYFYDKSNDDQKYFRNYIRKNFSNEFVGKFHQGLKRSFAYLDKERKELYDFESIKQIQGMIICPKKESLIARAVKMKGLILSAAQRKELLKTDCVLSGKIGIVYKNTSAIVFEYETCDKLPKTFKDSCRIAKIPKLLRAYLYNHKIDILMLNF
ncbi:tRNA lysidine(34) synthetase TilS [Campylobacter hepaticus]|uniref:tRNA(Ile)-lysidine synthase n=1 Tax=Campylobacter hepaticus TaxID=1813019 RepID=A0A6A7JTZ6_9BACT|nr:tRNA lysidine(34) synthetase TilS [Campylobacter hepaticus]AXP09046.1 tRNA lysidine(34) synthetase TilS [Campylobacter hepaticus]MCZ0771906.1 tRNA lysidine(34) synthetase TilS [Campylobacter hepaticus]MCZ0773375.1 tRNA lysidine(34) synthetase TilS [Campylobacter hepaticus]MCZ0774626.1 tRNA lysidine(34) synthetase TilS [Campylobacter hepaticus]MDX2323964.1 tRNA lysidine(34) synthetase TilS [Campylobacter hepaticus]